MKKSAREEPLRLPVKIDTTTNGEFWPRPLPPQLQRLKRSAMKAAGENARLLGVSRRDYLRTTCGAATVFLALNQLGCVGGRYNVSPESDRDQAAADAALRGGEFIFDVQTHEVTTDRAWLEIDRPNVGDFLKQVPQARCGGPSWVDCFTEDVLIREVFLDSDTQYGVLSALWGEPHPTPIDLAAHTRERVAKLEGNHRLQIHGIVQPNSAQSPEEVRERMQALRDEWQISAWKLYPVWGPDGRGYRLDGGLGMRTLQQGLDLGVPLFAVHKGLPLPGMDPTYTRPDDVGPAARAFPNATFLIYHSGFEDGHTEGPYDPNADRGVDVLIRSLEENGITGDGNVYAELGSTWHSVMRNPDEAAHTIGKLLKHLGEDRILWGTDCVWYGSPQDQIQAFRAFEISPEFQERYGYPALTAERKRKIFGLNAARVYGVNLDELRKAQRTDNVSRARAEYANAPSPTFQTYGPRTRREMLSLLRRSGGRPD
ncbi:MAG: amidohydrolase family protein [Myxococcaceae bacterium]